MNTVSKTTGARTLSILSVPVEAIESYEHAIDCVRSSISTNVKTFCVAINPEKVQRAATDPELLTVLRQANLRICDGVGVAIAAQLLHGRRLARCTGVDLFLHLMQAAAQEQWRVFFLGASPQANAAASSKLQQIYPSLQIAGRCDGYFKDTDAVIEQINASGADLLFVAMGSPRQEYWISHNIHRLRPVFCMGIGGTLDVVSGLARRAPAVFRNTGTEWLYRLLSQPTRVRRQLALPLFAWTVLCERFRAQTHTS